MKCRGMKCRPPHLSNSTYTLLKKNPTDSLSRKLDKVLKKLLKEGKISKTFHDNSRVLHPRAPQLYGLPKIHKPENPLRPIVSFYDTPLSALHKQLSEVIKPLTLSNIRLKNSEGFVTKFRSHIDHNHSYYCSRDFKSLYTTCDMRKAVDTVMDRLYLNPNILPPNLTPEGIKWLLNFSLDNAYCEFNNQFHKQITMGSPLTVTLAEIRITDIEQRAIANSTRKPKHYYHFVDDGFGHFINRNHAEEFLEHLNSLAHDLDYTIEHPSPDESISFLDVLIHSDTCTSIYRKPTNNNLYTHYSSSTTMSSKESVVRTLTRRAYNMCSPNISAMNSSTLNQHSCQTAILSRKFVV